MNREELENFKNRGPCSCGNTDCSYCSAIGDFKFMWAIAKAERDIYANQLQRALEIADALTDYMCDSLDAVAWRAMLSNLVSEVEGKPKPSEEHASEI